MNGVRDNLGEVIVIITSQEKAEQGKGDSVNEKNLYHPITQVFRFDFEQPRTNLESFINHVTKHEAIIGESMLKAAPIPFNE